MKNFESCVPLPLSMKREELKELVENAADWAMMNGMGTRSITNYSKNSIVFAPFALLPTPFPRNEFQNAIRVQVLLNKLMHRIAHDNRFLRETFREIIKVDPFVRKLFDIYETVLREGRAQPISLGLLRSDIMLDEKSFSSKQVEINSIASGFGWLGKISVELHKYILKLFGWQEKMKDIPDNKALDGLCSGMLKAHEIYGNKKAVILFVVEETTMNICDQRFHEFKLRELNPEIKVIRRTLAQIEETGTLDDRKQLIVGKHVVSVVYFRYGYMPNNYHGEKEWDARLLMERSLAIKSPSVHYQLIGAKKVQQVLASPGVLEQYLDNDEVELVRNIFTGLYSLNPNDGGDKVIERALKTPERFVLKPNREGGGNNLYNRELVKKLEYLKNQRNREEWILMDKICSPLQKNYMIKHNMDLELKETACEVGIFGVILGDDNNIFLNNYVGYMVRCKLATSNECGFMTGDGVCTSLYLID